MIKTALTATAAVAFVTALISAQAPQRAPDPRSMGGGDCRDNAANCADAPNPLPMPNTVWIEEMTWMDVRDSLKAGHTTAIIATGGMEPNGPWLVTGKHNYVMKTNCEAIARSLKMHGFKNIVMIGDSGGNQAGQKAVADKLTVQFAGAALVATIPGYYTAPPGTPNVLRQLGVTKDGMPDDGLHDSPGITLNMLLTDPNSVRWEARVKAKKATINGVDISNLDRSREWARAIVDARASRTVALIKQAIAEKKSS